MSCLERLASVIGEHPLTWCFVQHIPGHTPGAATTKWAAIKDKYGVNKEDKQEDM